jgi:hypothetical protein
MLFALPGYQFPYHTVMNRRLSTLLHSENVMRSRLTSQVVKLPTWRQWSGQQHCREREAGIAARAGCGCRFHPNKVTPRPLPAVKFLRRESAAAARTLPAVKILDWKKRRSCPAHLSSPLSQLLARSLAGWLALVPALPCAA